MLQQLLCNLFYLDKSVTIQVALLVANSQQSYMNLIVIYFAFLRLYLFHFTCKSSEVLLYCLLYTDI